MEREWWLRALLVLQAPRAVFGAMRRAGDAGADARQEPAVVLVFSAALVAVLSTPRFATLLDEPETDVLAVAAFGFVAAAAYALAGYFVLGAVLGLATRGSRRLARHVLAYALAPLALALAVVWPLRIAVHGRDVFRSGGTDGGADGALFALAELGLALWALALLTLGVSVVYRLPWTRAVAACAPVAAVAALGVALDRFL